MLEKRFKCPVAVHLVLVEKERLLLLRRQNTGFADGMYALPAGCLEGEESIVTAMIREAHEEIGITLEPEWLKAVVALHRFGDAENLESIVIFFTASRYEGLIENCEPDKCDDLHFFPLTHLPENIVPYMRRGIELALAGETVIAEFGW